MGVTDAAFYEAQAVVLSGMGQHKQALEVYVFKMNNYEKAEESVESSHIPGILETLRLTVYD